MGETPARKHWSESKIVLLGILGVVVAALADPSVAGILPLAWLPKILAVNAILNIVLRTTGGNKPLRK